MTRQRWVIEVDAEGQLVLPPQVAARLGAARGGRLELEADGEQFTLRPPVHQLRRLYVEPTNCCNLDCSTCMRNVWTEPPGMMSEGMFQQVLKGLAAFNPRPLVFFGGYGEPLWHPQIVDMVKQCKAAGCAVELISNGTLLNDAAARGLLEAGLDGLWISIDGATPTSYSDVRLGDCLPQVLENLADFASLRSVLKRTDCQLGVAVVAMRRNLQDLPDIIRLGMERGVERFSVSNVLAHTVDLHNQVLYGQALYDTQRQFPNRRVRIDLPRFDLNEDTRRVLGALLEQGLGLDASMAENLAPNRCPFVAKNSATVRWDGQLSPCLALLHAHSSYLGEHPRRSEAYFIGGLEERTLAELWNDRAYRELREKLVDFDFSPCVYCNSCEMAEHNLEDCFGNVLPTCGGCLWAQGLIRCP